MTGNKLPTVLLVALLLFFCAPAARAQNRFAVVRLNLVNSVRVTRTQYNYTYSVNAANNGVNAPGVRATVSSGSPHTVVVDGSLDFGTIAAGQTVTSSDTFIIRHDRSVPFDPAVLSFTFTYTAFRALPGATPRSGPAPLTVSFLTRAEYGEGTILRYRWDFQGDGIFDTNDPGARDYTHTFTSDGVYDAVLEVTNDKNQIATATVTITVTSSPPQATASVSPSNGAVPLRVSLTGSGTDSDGTIVKYEWDFEGDGVYDYASAATGSTTHVYSAAGTFNAVFRVTDNDGLTGLARVTTTAVRVGPPGSPTATITSPSNPSITVNAGQGLVFFNGTGSDPGGSIARYEWDFDGDGVYDFSSASTASTSFRYQSPGIYTAALRVTDNAGLTGIDTVDVIVSITITLSVPNETVRPLQGEIARISTSHNGTIDATLLIRSAAGQTVRTLVNNVRRPAGTYLDTWDGRDENGSIVPEDVYYAILRYDANGQIQSVDLTNTTGGQFFNPGYTLSTSTGSFSYLPFHPLEDEFLKADFTLSRASAVTVSVRNRRDGVDEVVSLFDRKVFGRGTNTIFWDGTDAAGRFVAPPPGVQFVWGMTAFSLPNNAMFVEAAPQITSVSVDPNYFDPATGNFISPERPAAKITYTLSKQASVALQVFRTGTNQLVRTINVFLAPAGQGTIQWDGRNGSGIFVDKGDYRLALKATDVSGNQSIVRYVLVRVFY